MQQRRGRTDPLRPVNEPRWLVIRDRFSRVIVSQRLAPNADLRAAIQAEADRRRNAGWVVDTVPRNCAFFFCDLENERLCVSVECYEPGPTGSARGTLRRPPRASRDPPEP
jgi:hypothetical protein